ncbi:MAG: Anaerobic ribonucleoside-triphosphate reductase activating protein [Candidatus Magnetoglobus multicellularis str. Araruama]|uniref:Anaerobic ribonucleoside-triphosphate reductase activating protein n=1 Tax=Candidatus Magnetoglobus multicellularis str. Araruama TaxID=890399 RepID=A0A1V1PHZ8_9BACT|nr:MAG: Anaerobic ribonucleoside-triphosphate reductase activating protein [Candidatus Magnetoglobus multicellularis str. Araruama]
MRFGGFIKNSLIDYPGKISSVVFFKGCNFRCPYCHNKELVFGQGHISSMSAPHSNMVDENIVFTFLERRKKLIDGVVLSGGEPTLTRSLKRICQKIKDIGYLIKIDTNGSYPSVLENLLYHKLIDYIAMDFKTSFDRYSRYVSKKVDLDAIKASIQLILDSDIDYEFRTTCARPIVDESVIHRMLPYAEGAQRYVLQKFVYSSEILDPDFFTNNNTTENDDMEAYQALIKPWVKECIIRA